MAFVLYAHGLSLIILFTGFQREIHSFNDKLTFWVTLLTFWLITHSSENVCSLSESLVFKEKDTHQRTFFHSYDSFIFKLLEKSLTPFVPFITLTFDSSSNMKSNCDTGSDITYNRSVNYSQNPNQPGTLQGTNARVDSGYGPRLV